MAAKNKKSGLSKKVSSIFDGIPEIESEKDKVPNPAQEQELVPPAKALEPPKEILPLEITGTPTITFETLPNEGVRDSIEKPKPAVFPTGVSATQEEFKYETSFYPPFFLHKRSAFADALKRFYNPNIAGLDIGTRSVKLVEIRPGLNGVFSLVGFGLKEFPLSVDISKDQNSIIDAIKDLLHMSGCQKKEFNTAIYGSKVNVVSVTVPNVQKKNELDAAVKWEFSKAASLSLPEAAFDYVRVENTSGGRTERIQTIAAAAKNDFLCDRITMLKKSGITAEHIGVIPFALENLMKYCGCGKGLVKTAFVDIGAKTTNICFFEGDRFQFSREIGIGGDDITSGMVGSIMSDKGYINLSYPDAEIVKRKYGIPSEDITYVGQKIAVARIMAFMRPVLEKVAGEIQRSIIYYQRLFKIDRIDSILLCGGGSNLKNLEQFLSKELKIPAKRLNPFNELKLVTGLEENKLFELGPRFAVAIGLALSSMPKINLVPEYVKKERAAGNIRFGAVAFGIITLLLFGLFYLYMGAHMTFYQEKLTDVKKIYTQVEPIMNKLKEYDSLNAKLRERKEALNKELKREPNWDGVLKEVSYVMPFGIFLTRINIVKDSDPRVIRMEGIAQGPDSTEVGARVAAFMHALSKSPFFRFVDLQSQKDVPGYDESSASFVITAQVVY